MLENKNIFHMIGKNTLTDVYYQASSIRTKKSDLSNKIPLTIGHTLVIVWRFFEILLWTNYSMSTTRPQNAVSTLLHQEHNKLHMSVFAWIMGMSRL